jgi:thioredoxin 1
MLIEDVTGEQLEALISAHNIVFIDFWAEWCAPCKEFSKCYSKAADEYTDIQFVKVNIQNETELADTLQIRSIPHLMVFKQGIIIYSESGSMPYSALKELIEQAKAVDVSNIEPNS